MKQPMIEVYGEDAFSKLWAAWVEGVKNLYHEKGRVLALPEKASVGLCQAVTSYAEGGKISLLENLEL
ncbi:hypothetical protein EVAR_24809_1 [Eumeta japonica]|uniref:Uncharacterized protein n=1 Tax=Eumeta variegata TaxID=151549 RepID=A0A4C1W3Z8_EUMVA|nr:hypothetical protein EVAR_24809_1 [Eumeta japonica]